jgi:hypothetical protein
MTVVRQRIQGQLRADKSLFLPIGHPGGLTGAFVKWFQRRLDAADQPLDEGWEASDPYNGVPNLDRWEKEGWGTIPNNATETGPVSGNPWGIAKW